MFCPKCGNEVAEGSAFCGKCGAPVGGPAGAPAGGAPDGTGPVGGPGAPGAGGPAPKKGGAKVGVVAAAAVVAVVLVAGFATSWFGLGGVQPKEAVDVPAASQGAGEASGDGAQQDGSGDGRQGDAQGDAQSEAGASAATVKSAVEAYNWSELSQISNEIAAAGDEAAAIEVAKKYNLCTPEGKLDGTQVKSVTLTDGTQTTVQIVGFAHDDKTGGGKAGITFAFGDAIGEASMNPSATNAGGWEASQMRAYLNSDGMALLPEDMRAAIVPVDKLTNNVGLIEQTVESFMEQAPALVTVTSDSLWLFSVPELYGSVDWFDGYGHYNDQYSDEEINGALNDLLCSEGSEYQLFATEQMTEREEGMISFLAKDVLVRHFGNEPCSWWTRTPRPTYDEEFYDVSAEGGTFFWISASADLGLVPGFCV